jgi:hypothetical protein
LFLACFGLFWPIFGILGLIFMRSSGWFWMLVPRIVHPPSTDGSYPFPRAIPDHPFGRRIPNPHERIPNSMKEG